MADITPMIQYGLPPAGKTKKTFLDNPRNLIKKTVVTFHEFDLNDEKEFIYSRIAVEQFNVIEGQDVLINSFEVQRWVDNTTFVNYQGEIVDPSSETPKLTEWQYFKYLEANEIHIPTLKETYLDKMFNAGYFDKPKELQSVPQPLNFQNI
jgi:hypothetical protein